MEKNKKNNIKEQSNLSKRFVKVFTTSLVKGLKHYYVATYDKVMQTTEKPSDYIFSKDDLLHW